MLNTGLELPISLPEEDRMNLRPFADGIARALLADNYRIARGVKIGLEGSWGSGKSSLLNLVEAKLQEQTNDKIYLIRFDPWLVSGRDDLIVGFLRNLAETIKSKQQKSERVRDVVSKVTEYGTLLSPALNLIIPLSGEAVAAGLKTTGKGITPKSSLTKMRNDVETALAKLDRPLVVMIDELDRVEDSEVRTIAQLVRSVLDFPGISYILAYDPKRVALALGDGNEDRGTAYLEKIIQLRVPLPAQTPEALRHVMCEDFGGMLTGIADAPQIAFDQLLRLLDVAIPSFIRTIRDLRRALATFAVLEPMLRFEVDSVDLLGWAILVTNAPQVVRSLTSHVSELCGPALLTGDELLISYLDHPSCWWLGNTQLPEDIADKDNKLLKFLFSNSHESPYRNTLDVKDAFLTVLTQGCHIPRIPVVDVIQAAHGGYETFRKLAVEAWNRDSLPQFLGALRFGYDYMKTEEQTGVRDWLIKLAEDDEFFGTMLGARRRHRWLAIGFIIVIHQNKGPNYPDYDSFRLSEGLCAGHSVLVSHILYLALEPVRHINYDRFVERDQLGQFIYEMHLDSLAEDLKKWADKRVERSELTCSLRDAGQIEALRLAVGPDDNDYPDKIWKELIINDKSIEKFLDLIYGDECSLPARHRQEIVCEKIRESREAKSELPPAEFREVISNLERINLSRQL